MHSYSPFSIWVGLHSGTNLILNKNFSANRKPSYVDLVSSDRGSSQLNNFNLKNFFGGIAKKEKLFKFNNQSYSSHLVIERRFRKVDPGLIYRSMRLAKKYKSDNLVFLLDIYYSRGEDGMAAINLNPKAVRNYAKFQDKRYFLLELTCTLREILLMSEDPSFAWIDGDVYPLISLRNTYPVISMFRICVCLLAMEDKLTKTFHSNIYDCPILILEKHYLFNEND